MSLFAKVKQTKTEAAKDTVGGFVVHDSGVYPAQVIRMFGVKAESGAIGVTLELNLFLDENMPEQATRYNETIYVTNSDGENFYTSSKDKKNYTNSGWLLIDALALFATNGEAGLADDLETEQIFIKRKVNDKEVNVETELYSELTGLDFMVGLHKIQKPASKKVDGKWVEDAEADPVTENRIDRVFNEEGFTILEIEKELDEPKFIDEWEKTWKGKMKIQKAKPVAATSRTGGAGRQAAATRGNTSRAPARTSARPSRFTK